MADKLPTVNDFYEYVEKTLETADAWSIELIQTMVDFMDNDSILSLCQIYLDYNESLVRYIKACRDSVEPNSDVGDVIDFMAWVEFAEDERSRAYYMFIDYFNEL